MYSREGRGTQCELRCRLLRLRAGCDAAGCRIPLRENSTAPPLKPLLLLLLLLSSSSVTAIDSFSYLFRYFCKYLDLVHAFSTEDRLALAIWMRT